MGRRRRPGYLRSLVDYWANDFDWRAAEARLNAYPQFIDRGQHFVHVRRDSSRPPVLLAHGWPSSFVEMLPLADLLDVDVVVPSLPGFLFSALPDGQLTRAAIAETFHALMTETLGYERYFAFGGDIGGAASGWLATMYPQEVAGLHVIHGPFPADFDASPITAEEQAFLDADEAYDETDAGYSWIMSTRPDTIAAALADSPIGLAAWIIDKLRAWSDCGGDLEPRFDRDTLCTMLTLYWATECIGSSFRQYLDYPHNTPATADHRAGGGHAELRTAVRSLSAFHRRSRGQRHPSVFGTRPRRSFPRVRRAAAHRRRTRRIHARRRLTRSPPNAAPPIRAPTAPGTTPPPTRLAVGFGYCSISSPRGVLRTSRGVGRWPASRVLRTDRRPRAQAVARRSDRSVPCSTSIDRTNVRTWRDRRPGTPPRRSDHASVHRRQ